MRVQAQLLEMSLRQFSYSELIGIEGLYCGKILKTVGNYDQRCERHACDHE
jgi:hypothetical protein